MRPVRLAAVVLALAGCGGGGSATGTTVASTTTTTAPEASTTTGTTEAPATSSTEDLSGEGIGDVEAAAADLLLAPGEFGDPSLQDQGYVPAEAGPCGADVDSDLPPIALVGTTLGNGLQLVVEELRVYPTVDDAVAAVAAIRAGPGCGPATVASAQVGGDEAHTADVEDGRFVVARAADVVVTFWMYDVEDPLEVAAFGVGKLLAYLEEG